MNRSPSPVHLHVNRKAPVHVHVSTSPKPERKARRMKASEWVKASSSNKGPWVPPPGRTTKTTATRMSWEGPTHRLEIEPGYDGDGTTRLHVSDLDSAVDGSTDIILEPSEGNGTQTKLNNLRAEVNTLKTEMERQRSIRELDERELERQATQSRLSSRGDHRKPPHSPIAKLFQDSQDAAQVNSNRESLIQTLTEAELDLNSVNRQIDLVKEALKLLIRDKCLSPSRARETNDQSCILQDRLSELLLTLKSAKHLLRSQQMKESKIKHYTEEIEVLLRRLSDSETMVTSLKEQMEDRERLTQHSQHLHEQVTEKERNIQTLTVKIQNLEDSLTQRELDFAQLKSDLHSIKRKADLDKDALKRTNKQQKDKMWKTEKSAEALSSQVDCLMSELEIERSRNARLTREKTQVDTELQSIRNQFKDLERSLNTTSIKLSERNREYGGLQLENDQNKATVCTLEERLRTNETQMLSAQATLSEAQNTIAQYEGLLADYKTQLDKHEYELHQKDQEIERLQHDSFIEMEKSKIAYQKQISDLEPLSDQLKATTIKLQDSQEKLAFYEQTTTDQTKTIANLTAKNTAMDSLKDKLQEKKAELKAVAVKIELLEKRLVENEKQNKDLLALTTRKEEIIQQLQLKEEQYIEEMASLNRQLDTSRSESRRKLEDAKERSDSKERSQLAKLADIEAQLGRMNGQLAQTKRAKEETERKSQSKLRELQERLDQSQATRKSLENYVNFLKSSYSSIFNDSSVPTWKSPLTH